MSAQPVKLDMDRIIDDRRTRIIVCCGSGGVGKTTAAAAIGLRAAERGRQACVLTVDPARRLAHAAPCSLRAAASWYRLARSIPSGIIGSS